MPTDGSPHPQVAARGAGYAVPNPAEKGPSLKPETTLRAVPPAEPRAASREPRAASAASSPSHTRSKLLEIGWWVAGIIALLSGGRMFATSDLLDAVLRGVATGVGTMAIWTAVVCACSSLGSQASGVRRQASVPEGAAPPRSETSQGSLPRFGAGGEGSLPRFGRGADSGGGAERSEVVIGGVDTSN